MPALRSHGPRGHGGGAAVSIETVALQAVRSLLVWASQDLGGKKMLCAVCCYTDAHSSDCPVAAIQRYLAEVRP